MKSKRNRNKKQNKIKEEQKKDRGREERSHMGNFESMIQ
jgi:hypothetical protein